MCLARERAMTTVSAPVEIPLLRRPAVRWGLGFVAFIVALNLLAVAIGSFLPAPSGPRVVVVRYVVARARRLRGARRRSLGHPVTRLRETPDRAEPHPRSTVVLLDPQGDVGPAGRRRAAQLRRRRRSRRRGRRRHRAARDRPGRHHDHVDAGLGRDRAREFDSLECGGVVTGGAGRYDCSLGEGRRCVGVPRGRSCARSAGGSCCCPTARRCRTSCSARADNAALGAALAGAAGRPVVFAETVHGYGAATGLAALPARSEVGARPARLGGRRAPGRALAPARAGGRRRRRACPPRRAHVDALASALGPGGDAAPRRRGYGRRRGRRGDAPGGLPPDCGGEPLRRASLALGSSDEEAGAADQRDCARRRCSPARPCCWRSCDRRDMR